MTEILDNGWREQAARVVTRMQDEVYRLCHSKGWYEDERSVGDLCALLHSEVSEVLEAYRKKGFQDASKTIYGVSEDGRDRVVKGEKPEGVGSEMADILIRLLDMAKRWDVNLIAEYERKMRYNWTRPHRHGDKYRV